MKRLIDNELMNYHIYTFTQDGEYKGKVIVHIDINGYQSEIYIHGKKPLYKTFAAHEVSHKLHCLSGLNILGLEITFIWDDKKIIEELLNENNVKVTKIL